MKETESVTLAKSAMRSLVVGVGLSLIATVPAFAEVRVAIHDGLVSVVARDATVPQILAEWARVGQTKIVNGERVAGGPISLELTDVPEQQALDLLLRSISGYIAAPRPTASVNLSRYDRIIVMPAAATPRPPMTTVTTAPPPVFQQPQIARPAPMPALAGPGGAMPDDDAEEVRSQPNFGGAAVNQRGAAFQPLQQHQVSPQPQIVNPYSPPTPTGGVPFQPPLQQQQPAPPAPSPYPTAPSGGVAVPGMIVPSPQPPNQPGQVPNPQQPRRPGGQ